MTDQICKHCYMGTNTEMLAFIGYRQLWSKDKNLLVQVFTDLETDSIALVTIDSRPNGLSAWESITQVKGN